jgi:hypothetical protein
LQKACVPQVLLEVAATVPVESAVIEMVAIRKRSGGGMMQAGNTMILCDVCEQAKECTPRLIEGKEYDICADCWNPLAEKLKGKGRKRDRREMVFLPPLKSEPEPPATKPAPLEPPKIWGEADRLQ